MRPWEGVISIPEQQVKDYRIEHVKKEPGTEIPTQSLRNTVIGGQKYQKPITFERETTWHKLCYEGGVWVTDYPIEQIQHDNILKPFTGRVLIGGLGIGYAATVLARRKSVYDIVVIENSYEVCKMVKPHLLSNLKLKSQREKITVICMDLFDYIKQADYAEEWFDYAFYDIWQRDSESTFFKTVCPLREISKFILDERKLLCWNEDVMRGQLALGLLGNIMFADREGLQTKILYEYIDESKPEAVYVNWKVPFLRMYRDGVFEGRNVSELAVKYCNLVGLTDWKERWEAFSSLLRT